MSAAAETPVPVEQRKEPVFTPPTRVATAEKSGEEFVVNVTDKDLWSEHKHGIPKQIVSVGERSYFVDLRHEHLWQVDRENPEHTAHWRIGEPGNWVTAVVPNQDGSLFVVTQETLLLARPRPNNEPPEIINLGAVPGLGEHVRVNNASIIDGKLFIGTSLKDPNAYAANKGKSNVGELDRSEMPAALYMVDPKTLEFIPMAQGFGVVNAIADLSPSDVPASNEHPHLITYGDSAPGVEHLHLAKFDGKNVSPVSGLSFIGSGGRPDGANPVQWKNPDTGEFETCLAIAAIDSNEVRILNQDLRQVGKIVLPPEIEKPTMASFRMAKDGTSVELYVTTLEKDATKKDGLNGKVFAVQLDPEQFRPVEQTARYKNFDAIRKDLMEKTVRYDLKSGKPMTASPRKDAVAIEENLMREVIGILGGRGTITTEHAAKDYVTWKLLEASRGPQVRKTTLDKKIAGLKTALQGALEKACPDEAESKMAAIDAACDKNLKPLYDARNVTAPGKHTSRIQVYAAPRVRQ